MKKPFQVGERVAVYFGHGRSVGIIQDVDAHGIIRWTGDDKYDYAAHPRQCRRLVKKKRREIWCRLDMSLPPKWEVSIAVPQPDIGWIRFIEAKNQ